MVSSCFTGTQSVTQQRKQEKLLLTERNLEQDREKKEEKKEEKNKLGCKCTRSLSAPVPELVLVFIFIFVFIMLGVFRELTLHFLELTSLH